MTSSKTSVLSPEDRILAEDFRRIINSSLPWDRLKNASILITGATGMLPSYVALALLWYREQHPESGISITVLVRNLESARKRFTKYWDQGYFRVTQADVCQSILTSAKFDYIIHGASPADPRKFATDPTGVFLANILGTYHVLELARRSSSRGVLFMSSGEIYGHLPATLERVQEDVYGTLDHLAIRSCYAEGKRAGETLCALYANQYQLPVKIVRISHTFGPTMDIDHDSRVFAEFVKCVIDRQNIQMKSDGSAVRPFCYLSDAMEAMLLVLLLGESGQAYNLCGDEYYSVLELAGMLCGLFRNETCTSREYAGRHLIIIWRQKKCQLSELITKN